LAYQSASLIGVQETHPVGDRPRQMCIYICLIAVNDHDARRFQLDQRTKSGYRRWKLSNGYLIC